MNILSFICLFGLCVPDRNYFELNDGTAVMLVKEGKVNFHAVKQKPVNSSQDKSYTVNVIELPTQLIIVDFGFILPDSQKASNYVKSLNKPIGFCLLTHHHIDHYGGFEAFREICPKVLMLQESINVINTTFALNANGTGPAARAILKAASVIQLGKQLIEGVEFIFEAEGGTETADFLFLRMPQQQAAFAGDAIGVKKHKWLLDNHNLATWLAWYNKIRYVYAYRNVFQGHGHPVDWSKDENYKENYEYLDFIRNVANTYKNKEKYVATVVQKYPNFESPFLVPIPFDWANTQE